VRTASSAVCLGSSPQRISLERLGNYQFSGGIQPATPSAFERQNHLQAVVATCVPVTPGQAPVSRTSDGHKLAAMRPEEFYVKRVSNISGLP
jgi:hypothetical protein